MGIAVLDEGDGRVVDRANARCARIATFNSVIICCRVLFGGGCRRLPFPQRLWRADVSDPVEIEAVARQVCVLLRHRHDGSSSKRNRLLGDSRRGHHEVRPGTAANPATSR
jgi:hypothetical protein